MASTKEYLVGPTIGEGSFGKVVFARHKTSGRDVAIKVFEKISLHKQPKLLQSIWTERNLLQQFQASPFVVNLWGAFDDANCVYLVMECIKGGDLKFLIKEALQKDKTVWKTTAASHYALQLTMAIEFLHQQSTIHADLKPENVLVTPQGKLQLADFGSAFCLENGQQSTRHSIRGPSAESPVLGATMDYASPEILRGTPISELGIATDLWSLGCILGAMQWGESPFHAASDALALDAILNYANGIKVPIVLKNDCEGDDLPEEWKSLILGLLNPNPGLRLGVDGSLLSDLIPGRKSLDLSVDPAVLPPEPKWVADSKTIAMADGSQGWSAFLM